MGGRAPSRAPATSGLFRSLAVRAASCQRVTMTSRRPIGAEGRFGFRFNYVLRLGQFGKKITETLVLIKGVGCGVSKGVEYSCKLLTLQAGHP
jgi:hypothetical protein